MTETPRGELASYFQDQYAETGNPLCLLTSFCHLSASPDEAGNVILPQWMASRLAEGFASYLDGLTADPKTNLEEQLRITGEHKQSAVRTSLETMTEWVHRIVWLFDIGGAEAVHAVYMEFESDIKSMGLSPELQGITRDESSFLQFYHRRAKKGFKEFLENEARGANPTEDQKNELLANWGETATRYIRQKVRLKSL